MNCNRNFCDVVLSLWETFGVCGPVKLCGYKMEFLVPSRFSSVREFKTAALLGKK